MELPLEPKPIEEDFEGKGKQVPKSFFETLRDVPKRLFLLFDRSFDGSRVRKRPVGAGGGIGPDRTFRGSAVA